MPGMNSGLNVNDPTVVAAFRSALLHQALIALLIFAVLGLAWAGLRAWRPAGTLYPAPAAGPEPAAGSFWWSASATCGCSTRSCKLSQRWRSDCRPS